MAVNQTSDALSKKLPPTDSRFRPDLRLWESADLKNAEAAKVKVE